MSYDHTLISLSEHFFITMSHYEDVTIVSDHVITYEDNYECNHKDNYKGNKMIIKMIMKMFA